VKIKTLAAAAALVVSALALTGCTAAPNQDAAHPAGGFWATLTVSNKPVNDVWCIVASEYSDDSYTCPWSTLSDPGTHAGAKKVDGAYRYAITADRVQHKVLCVTYAVRGYNTVDCNLDAPVN
jgi:hypothetical protein